MRTRVKNLWHYSELEDALSAVAHGADAIGSRFLCASSPRNV